MRPSLLVLRALQCACEELPSGGQLVLAVSGGVDSMVLLEAAARLRAKNFSSRGLLVAHVNHALRGRESDADEALVLARAAELGLECVSKRLTWQGEKPSQNACRRRRDELFRSLLRGPRDRVLFAHHRNDQAETVLLRLIRGTGAKGLKGMLPVSGWKVRPFLGIDKAILLAAAAEWDLHWREDGSNASLVYDRNWVRALFAQIEERRPGFQRKLAALAEEARGWPQAKAAFPAFALSESISFSRPAPDTKASALSDAFGLGRAHAKELTVLLAKSSGCVEAKGIRFTWSAGLLLSERGGERFSPRLSHLESGRLRSELGMWTLPEKMAAVPARGDSGKKAFQAGRVPVFFRGAIPLVRDRRGRPLALLPGALERVESAAFSPSPLAEWWLSVRS